MKMSNSGVIFTAIPSKSNEYYQPFYKDIISFNEKLSEDVSLTDRHISLTIEHHTFETDCFEYDDIWLRDVAPVVTKHIVKFKYQPNYLPKSESRNLDKQFTKWLNSHDFEYIKSPLILDGGNLIYNKKDTVILTDRVLEDNYKWKRRDIIDQLKWDLDVSRVIIVPSEPKDALAHADGMVKFINEHTMFISDFLGDDEFRNEVQEIIKKQMPKAKFVVVPSSYTSKGQYDKGISSAKGLYINMLETDENIYLPKFDLPKDEEVFKYIQTHTDKDVIQAYVGNLSTMGGAINCLTWYCPAHLLPSSFDKNNNKNVFSLSKSTSNLFGGKN